MQQRTAARSAKKQFIPLDSIAEITDSEDNPDDSRHYINRDMISENLKTFLNREDYLFIQKFISANKLSFSVLQNLKSSTLLLQNRIDFARRFYPDCKMSELPNAADSELSENEIIEHYKRVYLGIERNFPAGFFKTQAKKRAAVVTRFLVNDILKKDAETILSENDELFFIRYKLQGVYRLLIIR